MNFEVKMLLAWLALSASIALALWLTVEHFFGALT